MKLYESGEYRATKVWPYAIAAGCVVYRTVDGDVQIMLLVRDGTKPDRPDWFGKEVTYHLPKGHCAVDENFMDAALRETKEESGVTAKIESYAGSLLDSFTHPGKNIVTTKTVHYYIAKLQHETEESDHEHDGKIWTSLEEAEKLLSKPNPKGEDEIIRRLRRFLELTT